MGDHLRVDLALLQSTADALGRLKAEFDDAGDIADHGSDAVGADSLRDVLDDFASNWKHHRSGIVEGIDAVHKMAETGHNGYIEVDDKLAADLQVGR